MRTVFKSFTFFLITLNAFAFKFSPMSTSINLKQNDNSALMSVENDSSMPIAVQLTLAKRIMDINGEETYPEELESLTVYPSQLILPPFEKRSIKITYIGDKNIDVEKSYRVIAEQLPLEIDKNIKKTNVKILLRYIAALYVDNDKTESNIEIKDFKLKDDKIEILVKNSGSRHQVLSNLKLIVKNPDSKEDILIDNKSLKGFSGENVLSGVERIFKLPLNDELKKIKKDSKLELKFDKE